ncbi:uncharacterized protein [Prorops nasuta]|uniref:uncharacterized protein n=1 Tax=Prorops nasuta TaxID=863751 RepID=UPI0034CF7A06
MVDNLNSYLITLERSSRSSSSSNSSGSSNSNNILAINDESSDASSVIEERDDILFPLLQFLLNGRRRHRVDNYIETVHQWTDEEFKEHLRLRRHTAYVLIHELESSEVLPQHNFGRRVITAEWSFLIYLWYMSNTEPLRTIADRFDVSISSVFRVIRRVTSWLLSKLVNNIKWPSENRINSIKRGFYSKKGLNNCIGAIDGCHIKVEKPPHNGKDYYNRKKFYSLNLQAVVDSRMVFRNIYCGEPGSLHDARVLRKSALFQHAQESKEDLFPNDTYIIGDSAYPSLPWLVPPFRDNGHLSLQQKEFNYLHSSTRMAVEKAFGVLKGRFRRIKFFTELRNMQFVTELIVCACILHNICINEGEAVDDLYMQEEEQGNYEEENINIHENSNNNDRRAILFQEMFLQ